ncbi:unnamed protein product [Blepharisma stoltei]|uniref:F-box domain-containing protein n=1 Tax=Blepharisma stoltei TaxID=1481888 RepID=A0AAU9IZE6_9CILI|nr:unnamed protein product [Blepharisma stoltei]
MELRGKELNKSIATRKKEVLENTSILSEICQFLELKDVARMRSVSKIMNVIIKDSQFIWKPILQRTFPEVRILDHLTWQSLKNVYKSLRDYHYLTFEPHSSYTVGIIGSLGKLKPYPDIHSPEIESSGIFGGYSNYLLGKHIISISVLSIPSIKSIRKLRAEIQCWILQVNGQAQGWENVLDEHVTNFKMNQIKSSQILIVINSDQEYKTDFILDLEKKFKIVILKYIDNKTFENLTKAILKICRNDGETERKVYEKQLIRTNIDENSVQETNDSNNCILS